MTIEEIYSQCRCLYLYAKKEYPTKSFNIHNNFIWIIGHKIIRIMEEDFRTNYGFYCHSSNCIATIFGIPIKVIDYQNPEEIKLYMEVK